MDGIGAYVVERQLDLQSRRAQGQNGMFGERIRASTHFVIVSLVETFHANEFEPPADLHFNTVFFTERLEPCLRLAIPGIAIFNSDFVFGVTTIFERLGLWVEFSHAEVRHNFCSVMLLPRFRPIGLLGVLDTTDKVLVLHIELDFLDSKWIEVLELAARAVLGVPLIRNLLLEE